MNEVEQIMNIPWNGAPDIKSNHPILQSSVHHHRQFLGALDQVLHEANDNIIISYFEQWISRTPHIVQPSPHPDIIWLDSWRSCPSCLRRGITTLAHLMGRWGSSHDVCHHFAVACLEDKQLNTYFTKPVFCNNSLLYKTHFFFDFFYQNWGKILNMQL